MKRYNLKDGWHIGRIASRVIRYDDLTKYREEVNKTYERLNMPNPPGDGELENSYPFEISRGIFKKSEELKLVWKDKSNSKKTDIKITYQEVVSKPNHNRDKYSTTPLQFQEAYNDFLSQPQYKKVDSPYADNVPAAGEEPTLRCLFDDGNGKEFGLIANPPFPRGKKRKKRRIGSSTAFLPITVFALGALLVGTVWFYRDALRQR